MDDKIFLDYITNKFNLDDSLDNENSSINIDQVIKGNLIAIRDICNDGDTTPGNIVLNYIESKIESLIRSEEEEVEMLDFESFLNQLSRDLNLYREKPNQSESFIELLQITQQIQNEMHDHSWDAKFNISLDENGNPITKTSIKVNDWLETSSSMPLETTTASSEKKSVRFDLKLNQVRNISPQRSESIPTRQLRSGRLIFMQDNFNQQDDSQYITPLEPSININQLVEQQTSCDVKFSTEELDSIVLTNSFDDTKEYVELGCSPIPIEPIDTQSTGTNTDNFLPRTKSVGTSPIKFVIQSYEPNSERLINQKLRNLFPIINRTIFRKTKKYLNYFVKKNGLLKGSGTKKICSVGTNTTRCMKKSQKVQTEENDNDRRKGTRLNKNKNNQQTLSQMYQQTVQDVLQKKGFTKRSSSTKRKVNYCGLKQNMESNDSKLSKQSHSGKPSNTCKKVKSTQQTISQIFQPVQANFQRKETRDLIDETLSLIRDYREPNDNEIRLTDFSDNTLTQLKIESPDYKSHSPLNIGDNMHKLEILTISEAKKPRRKLYSKVHYPEVIQNSTPIKSNNPEESIMSGYRRVPLEPKIIVLNPIEQVKHHIDIINNIPKNILDDKYKTKGMCDRLARVLMTPIEYTPHVTYTINQTTGCYEPIESMKDNSLEIPNAKIPEFVTSSQMHNNNDGSYFSISFSPISRIIS